MLTEEKHEEKLFILSTNEWMIIRNKNCKTLKHWWWEKYINKYAYLGSRILREGLKIKENYITLMDLHKKWKILRKLVVESHDQRRLQDRLCEYH